MQKIIIIFLVLIIISTVFLLFTNVYMIVKESSKIVDVEKIDIKDFDTILILGAGVKNNQPSPMLTDRLNAGVSAYNLNLTNKIIVSGDHGRIEYDEVNVMKNYLIEKGIDSSDIFIDHAGFSTYDSIYRAKEIFKAKKILIITQKYHLYRALYIASSLNVEALGISADTRRYSGQLNRDVRELLARSKEFIKCIFKPEAKILGDAIPVIGDGDITND